MKTWQGMKIEESSIKKEDSKFKMKYEASHYGKYDGIKFEEMNFSNPVTYENSDNKSSIVRVAKTGDNFVVMSFRNIKFPDNQIFLTQNDAKALAKYLLQYSK